MQTEKLYKLTIKADQIPSPEGMRGLAHLCTFTTEAAAPFAVFEGCALRTIRVGILTFYTSHRTSLSGLPAVNPPRF
jgi:hypothetical protein